ncbi:DsbA family protein [Hyphomicrobium sp. DY-1]|uniref:DsbA family protein n=1 Tax=Hyphomicrobium sp. DY-1 TaxID=3075650 RepID=UPI0039C06E2F
MISGMKRPYLMWLAVGALYCAFVSPRIASAGEFPKNQASLDAYIRDYILKNPSIVRQALLELQQQEDGDHAREVLRGYRKDIYGTNSPEIGDKAAKITIVEFYDYNCPYCRASYPRLKAFLKTHPDTKLLLKDTASFGKDSEAVGRLALAANIQGEFAAFHDALMSQKGTMTNVRALDIAKGLGINIERLKADASSAKISEALDQTRLLANKLNVTTTPLFIIGHNGIVGVPDDFDKQLASYVDAVRTAGCDAC